MAIYFSDTAVALAAGCNFEHQGEDIVSEIIDARTFRLQDGREVRLAGIEPIASSSDPAAIAALATLIVGRDVTLHGASDTPDRYGRQPAFVFAGQETTSVQSRLLADGAALMSPGIPDKGCAAELSAAESAARSAKRGVWARTDVIKNAESPGDILARIGQFTVVEGRVLSVRQAGATTYINFGRRWTQDFAVTISRRMMPLFERAGISTKTFEKQRVRVRGWVEKRGGPRIEAAQVGQIELLGER